MEGGRRVWADKLRQHIARCREAKPIPRRNSLTLADEWQCRILGGSLVNGLRRDQPHIIQEASALRVLDVDSDRLIVFTSTLPGLVAAREILGPDDDRVAYLLEDEFSTFNEQDYDEACRWHIHKWSFFVEGGHLETYARPKHPLPKGATYWIHDDGCVWAQNAGDAVQHLWTWDGVKPTLVEERFGWRIY